MGAIGFKLLRSTTMHFFIFCMFAIFWISSASIAQARDVLLLAGGGFAFRSYSQYTGAIIPLNSGKGALSKEGAIIRFWQKSFAFSYTTDLSPIGQKEARIDAVGGSVSGEFGYQKKMSKGQFATYIGLTYRHFELSPDDPGADLSRNPIGVPLTLDGSWSVADKIITATNLSYTVFHDDYWAQFKLGYQLSSTIILGPEIVFQGGDEYRYIRFGGFISGIKLGKFNLGANFGLRDDLRENKQSFYGDLHISFFY